MAQAPDKFISLTLGHFRCSSCSGYLSSSPIQLTPDGTWLCGTCSPNALDQTPCRELSLEAVLQNVSFPCKHQKNGCTQEALFNSIRVHEVECAFRTYGCPAMPSGCPWEGTAFQIAQHLTSRHAHLVSTGTAAGLGVRKRWRVLRRLLRIKPRGRD